MIILKILGKLDLLIFKLKLKWINFYFGKQSKKGWK